MALPRAAKPSWSHCRRSMPGLSDGSPGGMGRPQGLRSTFTGIAEGIGLDEKTVRHIFRDHVDELEKTVRFETPTWVGIARPS